MLALNDSQEEARSNANETKLDKPSPALISINMSGVCEDSVLENSPAGNLGFVTHNTVPYVDEVGVD